MRQDQEVSRGPVVERWRALRCFDAARRRHKRRPSPFRLTAQHTPSPTPPAPPRATRRPPVTSSGGAAAPPGRAPRSTTPPASGSQPSTAPPSSPIPCQAWSRTPSCRPRSQRWRPRARRRSRARSSARGSRASTTWACRRLARRAATAASRRWCGARRASCSSTSGSTATRCAAAAAGCGRVRVPLGLSSACSRAFAVITAAAPPPERAFNRAKLAPPPHTAGLHPLPRRVQPQAHRDDGRGHGGQVPRAAGGRARGAHARPDGRRAGADAPVQVGRRWALSHGGGWIFAVGSAADGMEAAAAVCFAQPPSPAHRPPLSPPPPTNHAPGASSPTRARCAPT
jgi:hypothetical protein